MFEYKRRVKYYETDRMGVVHHSNYLRIVEEARLSWCDENIMSYSEMEKHGCIIPALSAEENFINYLRFDDAFTVTVKLIEYKGVKMTFAYEIHNDNSGELCYTGKSSHFFAKDNGDETYSPYIGFRRDFPDCDKRLRESAAQS